MVRVSVGRKGRWAKSQPRRMKVEKSGWGWGRGGGRERGRGVLD